MSAEPLPVVEAPSRPAPVATPQRQPRNLRGLGFLATLATFATLGFGDGIATFVRAPASSRSAALLFWLLFHCTAALTSVGLLAGGVQELLLQAAARRAPLRTFAGFVLDGPRRWFASDPRAALGVVIAIATIVPGVGLLFPVGWYVVNFFHSKILMATAVMLASAALLAFSSLAALVVAWPVGWLFERPKVRRWVSPGGVIVVFVLVAALQTARFVRLHWLTFRNLDGTFAVVAGAALVVDVVAVSLLGRRVRLRARPLRLRTIGGTAGAAVLAFLLSGLSFGTRQAVMSTVLLRSVVTRYVVRPLQSAVDLDRDGYGVLFGGGDCNDHNARIHPGAYDVPNNGIDENCSGHDARNSVDEGDGRFAPVTGPLAGVRPNVIFISIDAVRPDHMSAYGYRRPTTPNIARFAERAARFTNAYCTSPRSLRSFASVFTGRYPSSISWGADNQFPPLADDNITLAEVLQQDGYATAAFNDAQYFSSTQGFYQGFQSVQEGRVFKDDINLTVQQVTARLRSQASGETRRLFAWVHLIDPHDPYDDLTTPQEFGHGDQDRYDEEIARADAAFGGMLEAIDALEQSGQPTVVVMFSDHGEGFGEHGQFTHSFDVHEEAMRVALIVRGPGIPAGVRDQLVSLFDLYPTILNLANQPVPRPVAGRSLVPVLFTPDAPAARAGWRHEIFGEVTPDGRLPAEVKTLIAPPWKAIFDLQRNTWELYNLARDPHETRNVYDDEPDVAARMRDRLMEWVESSGQTANQSAFLIEQNRLAREPAMQHPLHVRFGNLVELLGFDLRQDHFRAGDTIDFPMYLRVLSRSIEPVWLSVYFERVDGGGIPNNFWIAHYPIFGRYLTTQWRPGELLRDPMTLRVLPEIPPGRYRMLFAVEHVSRTNRFRPSRDARPGSEFALGEIEIVP